MVCVCVHVCVCVCVCVRVVVCGVWRVMWCVVYMCGVYVWCCGACVVHEDAGLGHNWVDYVVIVFSFFTLWFPRPLQWSSSTFKSSSLDNSPKLFDVVKLLFVLHQTCFLTNNSIVCFFVVVCDVKTKSVQSKSKWQKYVHQVKKERIL